MVMVLKSGKLSGLTIDELAIQNALSWIEQMTSTDGRTGYTEMGGPSSRLPAFQAAFPQEYSDAMTAVGVLTRIFAGRTLNDDDMISKGADRMALNLPRWSPDTGHIDFYYWYYGTLAMFQVGGDRWERWNEKIKEAIIDNQRNDAADHRYGSWDPIDPWGTAGGRIYSTAVNCLSMEVYYRYPRVFGAGKAPTTKKDDRKEEAARSLAGEKTREGG